MAFPNFRNKHAHEALVTPKAYLAYARSRGTVPLRPADHAGNDAPIGQTHMTSADVLEIVDLLESDGIDIWLDGGWGVDALLGKQTRPHGDLDIAVVHKDVPRLRALLEARGYRDVPRKDTKDWNFVLGDGQGHEVDVHSFTLDAEGRCVYGIEYPADSLRGFGSVNGRAVKCITAEHVARFRTGFELRETDIQDVQALHKRFGVPIPKEHAEWLKRKQA